MTAIPFDEDRLLDAVQQYQEALERGQRPDRRAFLGRHADLAGELEGYLDALDALAPAAAVLQKIPDAEMPLAPLGDFQIVREIGRGGMGVVYEAVQLSLGRRVALKVLPFAAALDSRQLQRFKNEAMAAASLHHSNIVPVYAVGCDRGVHYYAMQLIDGHTLAELIARPQALSGVTAVQAATLRSSSLGEGSEFYRNVARLMARAAEALEHAHGQGVIHRDVKPGNLMLDARGHLWVTDFGLAQFQEGADLTRTGDLVGTLRYMSPEQTAGQRVLIDHRTDIYSLGATFYELLTGQPLFAGESRAELLRRITNDEPRPARSLRRGVPAELETILLKCVCKLPGERYATARDLADDLGRFLTNQPILARRPGLIERGRKWARRHPGVVFVAGLLLFLSTLGLLVNQTLLAREQGRTAEALVREQERAEQAERRLRQTRQLVDFLIEVGQAELDDSPQQQGLRRRMLETALVHYQEMQADSHDDPRARAELANAAEHLRQVLADLATLQAGEHLTILGLDAVLDELKPSDAQRKRVRELTGRLQRERATAVHDGELTAAQKRQRYLELIREGDQELTAVLSTPQRKRLGQITLQAKGLLAFRDPDVLNRLRLTAAQRQRIRDIEGDLFRPPEGHRPGGFPRPPRMSEVVERCLEVLTPEQKTRWRELTGAPFELPGWHWFGPPPGGPRGPGGRPPGDGPRRP